MPNEKKPLTGIAYALYKGLASPIIHSAGMGCRHYPTCSDYAKQVFETEKYAIVAFGRSLWRIMRCGPWSRTLVDLPYPKAKSENQEEVKSK